MSLLNNDRRRNARVEFASDVKILGVDGTGARDLRYAHTSDRRAAGHKRLNQRARFEAIFPRTFENRPDIPPL